MPGVDIRLVRPDGSSAAEGEEGEIRARAPQMMKGYVDDSLDPAAYDEDGFFRTGDIGRFDTKGNLVVTGRLDT